MIDFMNTHVPEWDTAVEGERNGEGSPIKAFARFKSIHAEYLEEMETILEKKIISNGGTLALFYADARHALDGGKSFLLVHIHK
jgi:hypothetical protein